MTEVIISKNEMISEVEFEIQIKNMPGNFLGMAMDLQFSGEFEAEDYLGMEFGPVLSGEGFGQLPIKMVKALPDQNKVVLGLTFKANEVSQLQDGLLAVLKFRKKNLEISAIKNQVLSVYENGRRDLSGVIWTVAQESKQEESKQVSVVSSAKSPLLPHNNQVVALSDGEAIALVEAESNWNEVLLNIVNAPGEKVESSLPFWSIVPMILLVAGVVLYFLFKRFGKKVRELWSINADFA